MGKGGGCVPSKKKFPKADTTTPITPPIDRNDEAGTESAADEDQESMNDADAVSIPPLPKEKTHFKLVIVFYSMYGHVESLAKRMKLGADSVDGIEVALYRVPETLPDDVLVKMRAPAKDESIPVIESLEQLVEADGLLFGFPTRYGAMAAQMKAFFDSTVGLWKEQKLAGKPAGFFVSTGTQGGGQETTAWTAITQLAHHGMLYVPTGYTFGAGMFKMDSIRGGSPYGAGVFAGDGTREPSDAELALAEHQGKYMAAIVKRIAGG